MQLGIRFLALCCIPINVYAHEQEQHHSADGSKKLTIQAAVSTT